MRRPIVAANWKMHKTRAEAGALAAAVCDALAGFDAADVVLCPPYTALHAVSEALSGSGIAIGGQDLHWEERGAFTGEISAGMLLDAGCRWVIVGHSERRSGFHETDETVRLKLRAAGAAGLRAIVCVGETLEQREAGRTEAVLESQVRGALAGLESQLGNIVVAYEPVWAIGTGRTATAEQAQAAHAHIRGLVADLAGVEAARSLRIQYGGSVNPANAAELFARPDVDGGLIGGASLSANSFVAIVHAAVPRGAS